MIGLSENMPRELKFTSFGATLGICLGLGFSFLFNDFWKLLFTFLYVVLTGIGFWGLRDEFFRIIK